MDGHGCVPIKIFFYNDRLWPTFGPKAVVCQSLIEVPKLRFQLSSFKEGLGLGAGVLNCFNQK